MVLFILAAGYATRLYPYTHNKPKPLLEIYDGILMIDDILTKASKLPDVNKIVVISNAKFYPQFVEWQEERKNPLVTVLNDGTDTVDNRLGAIGDIAFAANEEKVDEELVVIAGDNLFTYDLLEYYNYYKSTGGNCICVKEYESLEPLKSLGVCMLDDNNKVIDFEEKPQNPKSNKAVFATYMFKKETLPLIQEYINDKNNKDAPGYFIEWLHKKSDVYAYVMNGQCYDIGTVESYEDLRKNYKTLLEL